MFNFKDRIKTEAKDLHNATFDVVVIGSHLQAIVLAYLLEKKTSAKVLILEPSDRFGNDDAPIVLSEKTLTTQFGRLADNEGMKYCKTVLADEIADICGDAVDNSLFIFSEGQLIPFVGFGEVNFASRNETLNFCHPKQKRLAIDASEWREELFSAISANAYTLAEVTQFHFNADGSKVEKVTVNGAFELSADQFIFCSSPKELEKKMPADQLSVKQLQRIQKSKTFARVRMHLNHAISSDAESKSFISLSTKELYEPVLGEWTCNGAKTQSIWTTLTPTDLVEDSEHMASVIKYLKKGAQKFLGPNLESANAEKIHVEEDSHGFIEWDKKADFGAWPKCDNLWLCHQQLVEDSGVLGSLVAAAKSFEAVSAKLAPKDLGSTEEISTVEAEAVTGIDSPAIEL